MPRRTEAAAQLPRAGVTRRDFVRGTAALSLSGALPALAASAGEDVAGAPRPAAAGGPAVRSTAAFRVVVVGAGAFGGWSALALRRAGAKVTLVDAWGPGNSRSSSGGETRVIRGMYGADRLYVDWTVRSFELWHDFEEKRGSHLYTPTGALWMFQGDDGYARTSLPLLAEAGLPARELALAEARRRYPQVDFSGVGSVFFEERAGSLLARRACREVAAAFVAEGGELLEAEAQPGEPANGRLGALTLSDGRRLEADAFVFACGPWLGRLFPEAVGERIRPTRQEVLFFGPPAGDSSFGDAEFPVWIDFGERVLYGIPGNEARGFKVADDTHGETVNPTTLERKPTPEAIAVARELLRRRFPALAEAPLLESRVCQYESTSDGHFLIDRHPEASDIWLVGGGSGHGYKMGPAVGEHVAALVRGEAEPLPKFSLDRLAPIEDGGEDSQLSTGARAPLPRGR